MGQRRATGLTTAVVEWTLCRGESAGGISRRSEEGGGRRKGTLLKVTQPVKHPNAVYGRRRTTQQPTEGVHSGRMRGCGFWTEADVCCNEIG